MTVGLFIPCYIDQFYPQVGIATLELLEKLGVRVVVPLKQTCCGQPMANSGFEHLTGDCNRLFAKNFAEFDYIVSPSGSCVLHIKDHLHLDGQPGQGPHKHEGLHGHDGQSGGPGPHADDDQVRHIRTHIYELTEFLTDVLHVKSLSASFPHKVGVHQACHGQRGLHLSQMTELVADPFSKPLQLLNMVEGLEIVPLSRPDECCGFGGTFCVAEEAVSVKMGKDRVEDHRAHGAEYITAGDMSCLMHMEGILHRQGSPIRVKHIAEILNSPR
jgi:L-lactate dehydrogenase complex protein LldE